MSGGLKKVNAKLDKISYKDFLVELYESCDCPFCSSSLYVDKDDEITCESCGSTVGNLEEGIYD